EESDGGVPSAEGIRKILVHVLRAGGEPVVSRAVGGKFLIVCLEGQLVHQGAGMAVPYLSGLPGGQDAARRHQRRGHLPRAHQDGSGHGAGVADQIRPGQEGPHGMPQQEHRKAGEPLPRQLPPGIEVLHRPVPAAPGSEVQPGRPCRHGETVSQVVVARHGKAPLRQVGRQGLIPQDVLRHAMGEHQNRPGCHVRRPLHRMDAGPPVCGGEGKFVSHHGKIILSVLYCVPSGVGCLLSGSMIPHFRH
ncbi:hypothetical protein BBBGCB_BBBGCB_09525, partial [Dysosmobacter welbionis]